MCKKQDTAAPCKCKGIYKFQCSCSEKAVYVGETRSINTRALEHKKAAKNGKWTHSGLTQHREFCQKLIEWEPKILSKVNIKNPGQLKHHLRVEEALWIRRLDCGPGKGLNEDYGSYVKTDAWKPVFNDM